MKLQRYDDRIRPELDRVSVSNDCGQRICHWVRRTRGARTLRAAVNGVPAGQSDEKLFDRYRELIERVAAAKHAAGSADRIIRVDDLLPPIIDDGCVRPPPA